MEKLILWKDNMKNKRLRVTMGKATVIMFGRCLDNIKPSGKFPCSLCKKGRNSIFYTSCDAWVHKKCSGIKGRFVDRPDFKCH